MTQRKGVNVFIPEELLSDFRKYLSNEKTTPPVVVAQFMLNYTEHLEASFVAKSHRRKQEYDIKRGSLSLLVDADILGAFRKKTKKDGLSMNAVIQQFMHNYVAFMKERKHGGSDS